MSNRDGGPAFPSGALDVAANRVASSIYDGMSLRDWFAGQALAGALAADMDPSVAIRTAWLTADAMLAARKDDRDV